MSETSPRPLMAEELALLDMPSFAAQQTAPLRVPPGMLIGVEALDSVTVPTAGPGDLQGTNAKPSSGGPTPPRKTTKA